MDALDNTVQLILNTILPSWGIGVFGVSIGIFTIWYGITYNDKPSRIQGLAVFFLGIAYSFSYFDIGNSELRHLLIRLTVIWVIISILMSKIWRINEHR